jgi:hypothetical protein
MAARASSGAKTTSFFLRATHCRICHQFRKGNHITNAQRRSLGETPAAHLPCQIIGVRSLGRRLVHLPITCPVPRESIQRQVRLDVPNTVT